MSQIRSHTEYLIQTFAHFVVDIDEKCSLNGGFEYDLMMICDSGLLFLGHPIHIQLYTYLTYLLSPFPYSFPADKKTAKLPSILYAFDRTQLMKIRLQYSQEEGNGS